MPPRRFPSRTEAPADASKRYRVMKPLVFCASIALAALCTACNPSQEMTPTGTSSASSDSLLDKYTTIRLTTDLDVLSEKERQMIPLLIEAAEEMDAIFWMQAYGNRDSLLATIHDAGLRRFAEINYGPWDRLEGNEPFIAGVGPKPGGANF